MPTTPKEMVERIYTAFGEGDIAALTADFSADIVWNEAENYPYADRNPYRGVDQVLELFGRIAADWERFSVKVEKMIEGENHVVMLGRYQGIYRNTGTQVDAQAVHVWTFANGKIVQFQQYADTLAFARATGTKSRP